MCCEQLLTRKAEARLRNPKPGSAIAQAAEFGVDLTLLVECLRLTPEDRVRRLQRQIAALLSGYAVRDKVRMSTSMFNH